MPRFALLALILGAQNLLAPLPLSAAEEPLPPGVPRAQADMVRRTHQLVVQGKRAYLATTVGVLAVDISAPARPHYLGALLLPDSANDLALRGRLLLAANGPAGLVLAAPDAAGQLQQQGKLRLSGAAMGVAAAGQLALVASGTAGLQLIDIAQPLKPRKLQRHDTPGYCRDVVLRGELVYAGDGNAVTSYRLQGGRLRPLGRLELGGPIYELALQEQLLVVAAGTAGVVLLDVSRPEAPRVVGRAAVEDTAHGVALAGERAILADGTAGLALLDISRPEQPRELARLQTVRPVNKVLFAAGRIYAANDYDGLLVLKLGEDGALQVEGALPAR